MIEEEIIELNRNIQDLSDRFERLIEFLGKEKKDYSFFIYDGDPKGYHCCVSDSFPSRQLAEEYIDDSLTAKRDRFRANSFLFGHSPHNLFIERSILV